MKKTVIALALTLGATGTAQAADPWAGDFCMYDPTGALVSGACDPAVIGEIDTTAGTFSVSSTNTFFGSNWTAHGGTTFGPGTYTFDTIEGGLYTGVEVGAGQVGGHIFFNWGATDDIDVVNVWDVTTNPAGDTTYTSTDVTATNPVGPDGILGLSMIDGAFPGFNANFDMVIGAPPPPPLACGDLLVLTNPDTSIDINIATELLSTCINADGVVTFVSFTDPENGFVTNNGTVLTYTPNSGFGGLDSFTYTAKDDVLTATAGIEVQVGGELQGNFSMMDSTGAVFGGTNDVVFTWDGTSLNTDESDNTFGLMTIVSDKPQPFNGFVWTAHHVRVYGPRAEPYVFDSGCTVEELESQGCASGSANNSGPDISMTVGPDQFGAHILFDWNTTDNIDVVNVWDQNKQWDRLGHTGEDNKLWLGTAGLPPAEDANWELVSIDVDGDTINGSPMVDGPFIDFSANFNNKPDKAGIPPEPFVHTQQDTQLGDGILASMNIVALFASLMMLLGLRQIGRKK